MINDPDNLLINGAYQMPENIAGKMVLSRDGANLFALSESGLLTVPVGAAPLSPLAVLEGTVALVANDQCGVTADQQTQQISVRNDGRGRLTASTVRLLPPSSTVSEPPLSVTAQGPLPAWAVTDQAPDWDACTAKVPALVTVADQVPDWVAATGRPAPASTRVYGPPAAPWTR